MKILLVSIPNHHFFQWVKQLENSGHTVFWFDITDGAGFVEKIRWVKQYNGWKLKVNFPFRKRIKHYLPKFSRWLEKLNTHNFETVFEQKLLEIKPDIVHCFEMNLTGIPISSVMYKYPSITLMYSSWGSDMYYFREHGLQEYEVNSFLKRVNALISDCMRDYRIAIQNGFANQFLGVYPGNGGIAYPKSHVKQIADRDTIMVKGYESFGCKASVIIKALEIVPVELFDNLKIIVYSADDVIIEQIQNSNWFKSVQIQLLPRSQFLSNEVMLQLMGKANIHISNNISDGMPNTLLESMGMGAFPIQSNPGNASAEVITHGVNGFLIDDPLDSTALATLIQKAILDQALREEALVYNVTFAQHQYDRNRLQKEIEQLYQQVIISK